MKIWGSSMLNRLVRLSCFVFSPFAFVPIRVSLFVDCVFFFRPRRFGFFFFVATCFPLFFLVSSNNWEDDFGSSSSWHLCLGKFFDVLGSTGCWFVQGIGVCDEGGFLHNLFEST